MYPRSWDLSSFWMSLTFKECNLREDTNPTKQDLLYNLYLNATHMHPAERALTSDSQQIAL